MPIDDTRRICASYGARYSVHRVEPRSAGQNCAEHLCHICLRISRYAGRKNRLKLIRPWLKNCSMNYEQTVRTPSIDAPASIAVVPDVLAVRVESEAARERADRYFFETFVRLHRETEGFGYTGLRSTNEVDPVVFRADEALATGTVEPLVRELQEQVAHEVRTRFNKAREKKQHADETVQDGREFVSAYVQFVHFVEAVRTAATSHTVHDEPQRTDNEHDKHD